MLPKVGVFIPEHIICAVLVVTSTWEDIISIHSATITQSVKQNGCKFYMVKNQNSISFYIEEAALLVTNFALFTLFFWKYPQMFNKKERRIAHMHDFPKLLRICRSCWLYLKYSEVLWRYFEYHILNKQDSKRQICNILV